MSIEWMPTSNALPCDGEHVQFVLEHRDLALTGVYNRCVFASRWSEYEPAAVREWRQVPATGGTDTPAPAYPTSPVVTYPRPPEGGVQAGPESPYRRPRGAYVHDGFFVRAAVGPGFFAGWSGTAPDTRHFTGVTMSVDLAVGGTPARGLIIGGAYQMAHVFALAAKDDVINGNEPSLNGVTFSLVALGVFADYYPDPEEGLHFLGFVGTGELGVSRPNNNNTGTTASPGGVVVAAGGGYEWFVGQNLSIGVLARATLGLLSVQETFSTNQDTSVTAVIPSLLATGTYN